jgi:hypothetical protein
MKTRWMLTAAGLTLVTSLTTRVEAFVMVDPLERLSHVETVVTALGNGFYHYAYTVYNDSEPVTDGRMTIWPRIVGWEIPLDSPALVSKITFPETWGYRFLSSTEYEQEYGIPNPFNSLYVLQWYDLELFEGISLEKSIVPNGYNDFWGDDEYEPYASGFGFISVLAPVDGPYAAIWQDAYRNIGDPPLPGGGITGGGLPYTPQRAMPDGGATAVLLGLSLVGLHLWRKTSR